MLGTSTASAGACTGAAHHSYLTGLTLLCCVHAGAVIRPQSFFQCALFWMMPVVQPLLIVVLAALAAYTIAFAGVAALHFQPYIAPLLVGLPLSVADCRKVQAYMESMST